MANILTAKRETEYVASLMSYLREILRCEAAIIGFEDALQTNREAVAGLCIPQLIPEPQKPPASPIKPEPPTQKAPISKKPWIIAGIATAVGLIAPPAMTISVIVVIYQLVQMSKSKKAWMALYEKEMQIFEQREREYHEAYHQQLGQYNIKVKEYEAKKQAEELRIRKEHALRLLYEDQSNKLTDLVSDTKRTLAALYELNVIHAKYQNVGAVASFFDYLSAGRTSSLVREGADPGAYNLFEDDVRANRLIGTIGLVGRQVINTVNEQAEKIRANQHALYETVCEGNEISRAMSLQMGTMSSQLGTMSSQMDSMSSQLDEVQDTIDDGNVLAGVTARNAKLLTDAQRDRWGILRNKDGGIVDFGWN